MAKLLYQGHGSLRLISKRGTVVYIDPYKGNGYDEPADLILVTHQHPDHNRIDLPARAEGCKVIQNMDALKDGEYRKFTIQDITIEAVEAYNAKHPKEECVGYLVSADDVLLYFSGDTARTKQMETLAERKIDYAFLPIDGIFTMNVQEAIACAELIQAKHTIPVHMAPGRLFDARKAGKFVTKGAEILKPGEEIEL
ncbi:MAG: MBL fold metallo-hydrolase [Blautia sp.]|nr:MBL fold metallo-hydrolase [Blautia sp.]MCM1201727.1 MBL fold metallo-hydrolase [Bacteroides fragilis]